MPSKNRQASRMTDQRAAIIKFLQQSKKHPTAEQVYRQIRKKLPHISFGTVYRNLNFLKEQGVIKEIPLPEGASRFDGNEEKHHHFICQNCGKIIDLKEKMDQEIKQKYARQIPGKIIELRLNFWGICRSCSQKQPTIYLTN